MSTETPNPATASLWERTRAMFARAVAAVGAPAAIAALTLLPHSARAEIMRWLFLLESIVRKLLLADAGSLPPPSKQSGPKLIEIPLRGMCAPPANQTSPAKQRPGARAKSIDLTQPETWPAQFALSLPRAPTVPEGSAARIRDPWSAQPPLPPPSAPTLRRSQFAALQLARRFEAIRRVLNDPLPHVRRLALALRHAVYRCRDAVLRYFAASPRKYDYDPQDPRLRIEAFGQAYQAQFAFADTS